MSLSVTRCEDGEAWDGIARESAQATVFSSSVFLRLFDDVVFERWLVFDANRPLLGAVLVKGRDGKVLDSPYPFARPELFLTQPGVASQTHTRVKEGLEAMQALLAELERRHDRLRLRLHPGIQDVRALSWFHYHDRAQGLFEVDVRVTGWVDLQAVPDFDTYLSQIRPTRRNEYRQALRHGLTAETTTDVEVLDYLHRLTFERQGLERDPAESAMLTRVAAGAVREGFGEILLARAAGAEPVSATLFLHDHVAGHYVAGANHPEHRRLFGGTFCFLESVRRCMAQGLRRVDVCGINSPNRGDFKTSFNAAPQPYFEARWTRPASGGAR